jgi:hypothetical protein
MGVRCLVVLVAALAAGCAAHAPVVAPAPAMAAEEAQQLCLNRMYASRMRGAVHWHIYEYCLKEHS